MKQRIGKLALAAGIAAGSLIACSSKTQKQDSVVVPQQEAAVQTPAPMATVPTDLGASSAGLSH